MYVEWLNEKEANKQLKREQDYLNKVNGTNCKWKDQTAEEYLEDQELNISHVDGDFWLNDPVNGNVHKLYQVNGKDSNILNIGYTSDNMSINLLVKV